jgi:hypothetical protein
MGRKETERQWLPSSLPELSVICDGWKDAEDCISKPDLESHSNVFGRTGGRFRCSQQKRRLGQWNLFGY